MSGSRNLLDTNAIVSLLQGNKRLVELLGAASWVGVSVISKLEFLAFPKLPQADVDLFAEFEKRVSVVGLPADDSALLDAVISLRKSSGLKLRDAIIAASAMQSQVVLVTADEHFRSVKPLRVEWV